MIDRFNTQKLLNRLELKQFPEPRSIRLNNPVLLCHGYGAIASILKPSPLYDVAMLMRSHNVPAYAPNIIPYAKIETRAAGWVDIIHTLTDRLSCKKINIIAHSMGGLDMRHALSQMDVATKVESFTTVSTPHRGTSLAELTLKTPDAIQEKLAEFLDWVGDNIFPPGESDAAGSAKQLTRRYITETFNPATPDVEGIPYYSFSSAVGKNTNQPITVISRFQNNHIFEREGINDGIVSVESAKWGTHIKTGNISHLEQMNLSLKNSRQLLFKKFWLDVLENLEEKGH